MTSFAGFSLRLFECTSVYVSEPYLELLGSTAGDKCRAHSEYGGNSCFFGLSLSSPDRRTVRDSEVLAL